MKRIFVFAGLLFCSCVLHAQAQKPSLDEVLTKLDENRLAYAQALPSLFAAEHAVSTAVYRTRTSSTASTVTDSTFRVLRNDTGESLRFQEARTIQSINGAEAPADAVLTGPMLPSGLFANALMMVSATVRDCFQYKLKLHEEAGKPAVIELSFQQKSEGRSPAGCPRAEDSSGTVIIDAATMHILSIEKSMRVTQSATNSRGRWVWKVEYAPTEIGAYHLWLPHRIFSKMSTREGFESMPLVLSIGTTISHSIKSPLTSYSFEATYSDFHLFHTNAHILPSKDPPTVAPPSIETNSPDPLQPIEAK